MTRKVDRANGALSRLGISGITREPTPEDMAEALNQLEMFMRAELNRGLDLNYAFETTPDPATETNVNARFDDWIEAKLAERLIPYYGSSISSNRIAQIKADVRSLRSGVSAYRAAQRVRNVPYPNRMPRGHGNTQRYDLYDRFYSQDFQVNRDVLNNDPVPSTPDPDDPSQPSVVTGAENGTSIFTFSPTPSVFRSSISMVGENLFILSSNSIHRRTTAGVNLGSQFLNQGSVTSVCASSDGNLLALIDNSVPGTPDMRILKLSSTAPHNTISTVADISAGGAVGASADIVEGANGDIWLVTNQTDDLRRYNSSGVLQETIDISSIGQNASHLAYVNGDVWVGEENTNLFHRYSNGFTGNQFSMRENSAFGLAFDNNIFWEGGAVTGQVYRRPAVLT